MILKNQIDFEIQARHLKQIYGYDYVYEYKFHPTRKWRFDVCFPDVKLAAEIDGGVWIAGRHTRGAGFISDQDKTNEAQLLGWKVFRFCTADIQSGKFYDVMKRAFEGRKEES